MRLALLISCFASLLACGQDPATRMCLSENEHLTQLLAGSDRSTRREAVVVYQACAHACQTVGGEEVCKAYRDVTTHLCKEEQVLCKDLCEGTSGHKNETACALLE